jgi:NAD(P)-dependent dehydrogenase (short-subunit alcohol dehydrogenase family)
MRRLEGQVAVVTGASTGIGQATALRLASEGAATAIAYFEAPEVAEEMAERIRADGTDCIAVFCDVRDRATVTALADKVRERLGPVTALVNNAGIAYHSPFLDLAEAQWDEMMQVHAYGAFRVTQALAPDMLDAGSGSVVNITSELALVGEPNLAHYITAKCALIGLTKALAHEFGPHGVRVNAVAPGPTDTRLLTDEERSDEYRRRLPLQRLGAPADIAAAIAYLCSSDADWVTGQILSPNGGAVI